MIKFFNFRNASCWPYMAASFVFIIFTLFFVLLNRDEKSISTTKIDYTKKENLQEQTEENEEINFNNNNNNKWVVKITNGNVDEIANNCGFQNLGSITIGNLKDFYLFQLKEESRITRQLAETFIKKLESHENIDWFEEQKPRSRIHRPIPDNVEIGGL
eukprot:TRINITY_DN6012_c2_g2_i1.p1 TRINITY_DN6012_c2_g2~~TRINITY_DN6012_c2_g2_i1.p1  ORF type:complete len:159 (-),score=66.08 TRINITY_DN6012_c2_g2_i1:109-585(-)